MADHGPELPRAVRRPEAVIDLRTEAPARHRQNRGVPLEPDAFMRSYRNRPAHRGPRLPNGRAIDAASVDSAVDPTSLDATSLDATSTAARSTNRATPLFPSHPAPVPSELDQADRDPVDTGATGRRRVETGELVVRRLRLRSVTKLAFAFYLCLLAVVLVAGAVLWHLANEQGWVQGWTGFLVDIGFTDAAVDGTALFRASAAAGGILVVTATALTVVAAFFYNQLSGLFGGLVVTTSPRTKRIRGRSTRHHRRDT